MWWKLNQQLNRDACAPTVETKSYVGGWSARRRTHPTRSTRRIRAGSLSGRSDAAPAAPARRVAACIWTRKKKGERARVDESVTRHIFLSSHQDQHLYVAGRGP